MIIKIIKNYLEYYLFFIRKFKFNLDCNLNLNNNSNVKDIDRLKNAYNILNFDFEKIAAYLYAFYDLFSVIQFSFDKINEKLDMMYLIKKIIQNPLCFLRIDLRLHMEKIYSKVLGISVAGQNQSNNIEVLFNHAYGTKNLNNFMGRRYADETWLYNFIKDDRKGCFFIIIYLLNFCILSYF